MGNRISKKQIIVMLLVMLCLVVLYLVFSGSFQVSSSYKDVLSTANYTEIAEGDGWKAYMPEKEGLMCYFIHEGDQNPRSSIHVKTAVYSNDGDKTKHEIYEWYPGCDRHFFFGEKRYYFPEDIGNPQDIACKIVWSEYAGGKTHTSYVFSKGLSEKDKQAAMEEIDDIVVNENDNVPK